MYMIFFVRFCTTKTNVLAFWRNVLPPSLARQFGLRGCQGDTQGTVLSVMKKSFEVVQPMTAVKGSKRQHYLEPTGAEIHKQCFSKALTVGDAQTM
jgi:hypothetical protein